MSSFRSLSGHPLILCLLCVCTLLSACGPSRSLKEQVEGAQPEATLKWKTDLGEGVDGDPIVADGVVYVTSISQVHALDATTGQVKWKITPGGLLLSSPAVADDLVYFAATNYRDIDTRTGKVTAYALDGQTGSVRWQHVLSNDRSEDASNPIVADGLVYFGTGWSDFSCCESRGGGGHITALDAKTGELAWEIDTTGSYGSGGKPTTTFAVANGMLYLGDGYDSPAVDEGQLRALDARTGEIVWKIDANVNFPYVASDGMLYLLVDRHELFSVDGKTGQERWRWALDSTTESFSRPTVIEDTVYVVLNEERDICFEGSCRPASNHVDTLHALDSATGKEKWKQDVAGGYYATRDLVPFQQYLLYDLTINLSDTRSTYLRAVDRQDGKLKWQFKLDDSYIGVPIARDDTAYITTYDGTMHAIQAP